ncbi:MAG: FAD-dependent oxidoreductase [Polyangiales bacterium]
MSSETLRTDFLKAVRRDLPGALQEADGRAVILPANRDQVAMAMALAYQNRQALSVPGQGPGAAREGAIPLDLSRMADVIKFDEPSRIAHVQAGMRVHALEDELRRRGLSLGAHSSARDYGVGEWLALGAPGARDNADDPVEQVVAGLELVLPDGRPVNIRPAPRRAVGPDLVGALIGARGRLGVIVGAHVVARLRVESTPVGYLFPTREGAEQALAWIRGKGVRPIRAYVEDAPEGSALRLKLATGEGVAEAFREVARQTATGLGGVLIDAKLELPKARAPQGAPASAVVAELAARLDPRGVLG